jgi:hypothetical protein
MQRNRRVGSSGYPVYRIERIRSHPTDPAHGWVYLTLLSTLLPSFCNLLVGVASLLACSLPPIRRWLIATIPTLDGAGLSGTRR